MAIPEMSNNHPDRHTIALYDVMILFILKAPDQRKAIAALQTIFSPAAVAGMTDYKKKFNTYQDWRNHLAAALDNAQEKIDAQSR